MFNVAEVTFYFLIKVVLLLPYMIQLLYYINCTSNIKTKEINCLKKVKVVHLKLFS